MLYFGTMTAHHPFHIYHSKAHHGSFVCLFYTHNMNNYSGFINTPLICFNGFINAPWIIILNYKHTKPLQLYSVTNYHNSHDDVTTTKIPNCSIVPYCAYIYCFNYKRSYFLVTPIFLYILPQRISWQYFSDIMVYYLEDFQWYNGVYLEYSVI